MNLESVLSVLISIRKASLMVDPLKEAIVRIIMKKSIIDYMPSNRSMKE